MDDASESSFLRERLKKVQEERDELAELAELAWGLISNAGSGDWNKETEDWRDAAKRWRDRWMKTPKDAEKKTDG